MRASHPHVILRKIIFFSKLKNNDYQQKKQNTRNNGLLPTATTLQKWKWQSHNSCCLCAQQETRDHMPQCPALSQQKWRITTITVLWKRMKQLHTKLEVKNVICCAIAEWFETGHVPLYKYPEKFHDSI